MLAKSPRIFRTLIVALAKQLVEAAVIFYAAASGYNGSVFQRRLDLRLKDIIEIRRNILIRFDKDAVYVFDKRHVAYFDLCYGVFNDIDIDCSGTAEQAGACFVRSHAPR